MSKFKILIDKEIISKFNAYAESREEASGERKELTTYVL